MIRALDLSKSKDIPILSAVQGEMASWMNICSKEASRVLKDKWGGMGRRTRCDWGLPAFEVVVLASESKGWFRMDQTLCLNPVLVGSGFKREEPSDLHQ